MSAGGILTTLRAALEAAGVSYMVTGSLASSAHGTPRATQDVYVVIAPTREQLLALLRQFPESDFYLSEEDALQALQYHSQFNVIDQRSIWKIDFILRKERPFSQEEFSRRRQIEIAGVRVYAATPEDVLVAKLEWARMGESERQVNDAAGIIRVQGARLDISYIERWVEALGLEEQWSRAREKAAVDG